MNSHRKSYYLLLQGCLARGNLSHIEKKFLKDYRQANNITLAEHVKFLDDLGWTLDDFRRGIRSVDTDDNNENPNVKSVLHDVYDLLLLGCIHDNIIDEIEKSTLAMYRYDNHIEPEYHDVALRKVGWTKEEFDRGMKLTTVESTTSSS